MSKNCVRCISKDRTGPDLLCDDCRQANKKILYPIESAPVDKSGNHADFVFWCPGCECCHGAWTTHKNVAGAQWSFNGDMSKPTFAPSFHLNYEKTVCHFFITSGEINYCTDSTHKFSGKTIPMEAF